MTTKKTFEERAWELAESFTIEVEIRAMCWATENITPRDILVDLITQALQEAYKQGRDETREEIRDKGEI